MTLANKKLLIVSNRLPVTLEVSNGRSRIVPSSGGLVTALTGALKAHRPTWIGWPGCGSDQAGRFEVADLDGLNCRFVPVWLAEEEEAGFYYGFSNEIVWPLFHDLQSRCNFDPSYWATYLRVNRKFASVVARYIGEADCIWVHDYHLLMIAEQLRQTPLSAPLAYFHHIPFPSPDILGKLPWRKELLRATLHYDLLGFQTNHDLHNFVRCLRHFLGSEVRISARRDRAVIRTHGRDTVAEALPVSIDFQEFSSQAASQTVARMAESLRQSINSTHCLLGIDRLDYTKGIVERLRAFELLLKSTADLHKKVTLIQVVVPSREDIPKYRELRLEIERLVARINGQFTQDGWVPIQYVYRHLSRCELLAHYRACDVALVTPLKDGMNLVAKEFCAAQIQNDGVLILSEFAGSARQLKSGAILVNPNDLEGIAAGIRSAFNLSRQERAYRMRTMRRSIARHDVHSWLNAFWTSVETRPVPRQHLCAVVA